MGEPAKRLIDEDTLRRELRRVLSRAEAERIIARLYSDEERITVSERAERAAEGVKVDDLAIARARKSLRRRR